MKKILERYWKDTKTSVMEKVSITAGMSLIMVSMYALTAGVIIQHSGDYIMRKIKQGARHESAEHR